MSNENIEYLGNVETNRQIVRSSGGAEIEPSAQNIFAGIPKPGPLDLAHNVVQSMFRDLFAPALRAASRDEFLAFYKEHLKEFANRRYAAGLLYRQACEPLDPQRAIEAACSIADDAREPHLRQTIGDSWGTIQRANRARARILSNPRIAHLLTQAHREEYAAHCLNWAWGYGVGLAACDDGGDATSVAVEWAEIFMLQGARFAYMAFRRIEWDDMSPTDAELRTARTAFDAMGIKL